MSDTASIQMVIRGRVKGVGFRYFTLKRAESLGLKGYVRNLPDEEAVAVIAEGERSRLDIFIAALRTGPKLARVDNVEIKWSEYSGHYTKFIGRG